MTKRLGRCTQRVLIVGLAFLSMLGSAAYGQDLSAGLSNAESSAASAEAEVAESEAQLPTAETRYAVTTKRAVPARRAARSAQLQVEDLKEAHSKRQQAAAAGIARIEASHQDEVERHDSSVEGGIGFGLAALLVGAIALGWGWFRATAAVARLTELQHGQAIGVCVFGGFALLIIGAMMSDGSGLVAALGATLIFIGFVLPAALLLARHSAQVQRGRAKPILKRERLPEWVSRGIAIAMGLLVLVGFGSAIFSDSAEPAIVSAQLRREASGARSGLTIRRLASTEAKATELQKTASKLGAEQNVARRVLRQSRQQLNKAERRLTRAESSTRYFTRRLASVAARESHEAEVEAKEVARHEEEEISETEEALAEECDPNYSGCLDPNSPDYDCAGGSGDGPDYTGTVTVLGYDHYDLDADGDGTGCDP